MFPMVAGNGPNTIQYITITEAKKGSKKIYSYNYKAVEKEWPTVYSLTSFINKITKYSTVHHKKYIKIIYLKLDYFFMGQRNI